jgi:hypothetical protein
VLPQTTIPPVLPSLAPQHVLFQSETFKVVSRHHNMIGFAVDLGLMSKALHSAVNNDADVIDMKLTQKAVLVAGGEDGETENKPFLCITSRVSRSTHTQQA